MTLPHDCEARLSMLQQTIERNRKNLIPHDVESDTNSRSSSDTNK